MKDYMEFISGNKEIYPKSSKDIYLIFNGDKILLDNLGKIPKRDFLIKNKIDTLFIEYIGAYKGKNCYTGILNPIMKLNKLNFIYLKDFIENIKDSNYFTIGSRASLIKDFINNNKYCGLCSSVMELINFKGERALTCSQCKNIVWPKTSPAIIVAVIKNNKMLLVKSKAFKSKYYSPVAGFMEVGESLEDTVKREVLEETGIKIKNINYFGSQAWPFPNSTMVGFTAEYLNGKIKVNKDELIDARWFNKEELFDNYYKSRTLASKLIEWFLRQ